MSHEVSTSERIYAQLKNTVLTGEVGDHARLDFAELAEVYGVSTTPVREAAMRLFGEGLLELNPRGGARPLRLSEFRLRALLEAHAMVMAITTAGTTSPRPTRTTIDRDNGWARASDNEQRARIVFGELIRRLGNPELGDIIGRLGDRLMPYRLHEDQVLGDTRQELEALHAAAGEPALLRRLIRAYHRRRRAKVAQLVWAALADREPA